MPNALYKANNGCCDDTKRHNGGCCQQSFRNLHVLKPPLYFLTDTIRSAVVFCSPFSPCPICSIGFNRPSWALGGIVSFDQGTGAGFGVGYCAFFWNYRPPGWMILSLITPVIEEVFANPQASTSFFCDCGQITTKVVVMSRG